jgi:PD-(D/E)XK endonuclease
VDRGFDVFVPFGEGQPFDLAVHLGSNAFLRVQCKTARRVNGCLVFNSRATDHGRGQLSYAGLADMFGVYFPPTQGVYLVPVGEVPGFVGRLRVEPARNSQKRGVRLAASYEIDRWTIGRLHGVAASSASPSLELAVLS